MEDFEKDNKDSGLKADIQTEAPAVSDAGQQNQIVALLQENLRRSAEIAGMSRSIKAYIRRQNLWATLRFLILFVPIILGFLYLPPFVKDILSAYQAHFSSSASSSSLYR